MEKQYTIEEAAKLTSLSQRTVRRLCQKGAIKGKQPTGSRWLISESALNEFTTGVKSAPSNEKSKAQLDAEDRSAVAEARIKEAEADAKEAGYETVEDFVAAQKRTAKKEANIDDIINERVIRGVKEEQGEVEKKREAARLMDEKATHAINTTGKENKELRAVVGTLQDEVKRLTDLLDNKVAEEEKRLDDSANYKANLGSAVDALIGVHNTIQKVDDEGLETAKAVRPLLKQLQKIPTESIGMKLVDRVCREYMRLAEYYQDTKSSWQDSYDKQKVCRWLCGKVDVIEAVMRIPDGRRQVDEETGEAPEREPSLRP